MKITIAPMPLFAYFGQSEHLFRSTRTPVSSGKAVNCTFGESGDTSTDDMSYQPAPATVDADGGAIAFQANALGLLQPLELDNCKFFWNNASDGGGACWAGGLAMISAANCNFIGYRANWGSVPFSTIGRIECDSTKFVGHDQRSWRGPTTACAGVDSDARECTSSTRRPAVQNDQRIFRGNRKHLDHWDRRILADSNRVGRELRLTAIA